MRELLALALALLAGCRDGAPAPSPDDGGVPVDGSVTVRYSGLEQVYEQGIMRTCALNNGVCHNSKEYPSLQSIPALLDAIGAPCAVGALKAELVPNECEPEGDRLVSAALGVDVEIAHADVSPADTSTDLLTMATLRLSAPQPAGTGADFVVKRGAISFTVGNVTIAADGRSASIDLSAAPLTLKTFFDTRMFPWQPTMIRVADVNGDGVNGHSLGWALVKPGDPERSYLVGRLTQPRLGELMPRQCRTWDRDATRALYCWIRGLQMSDGRPLNAMAAIDYSACDLPADASNRCEATVPDGGAGTFAAVQAIFARSCTGGGCHSGAQPAADLDLSADRAYANLVDAASSEQPSRKRVVAGDAVASWLACKIDPACSDRSGGLMPLGGSTLAAADLDAIKSWIQSGAKP